jgi:hypothetical protein
MMHSACSKPIPKRLQEDFWDEMEEMAERGLIHHWMTQAMRDRAEEVCARRIQSLSNS